MGVMIMTSALMTLTAPCIASLGRRLMALPGQGSWPGSAP
jgi:hypothetical protein